VTDPRLTERETCHVGKGVGEEAEESETVTVYYRRNCRSSSNDTCNDETSGGLTTLTARG